MEEIIFAAAGDIHGNHLRLIERLEKATAGLDMPLAFILQVGDFEPVRDEADLATIAGPDERRRLGDFYLVLGGELRYPSEVLFIGGNHEPYGWLETLRDGGEVAPSIRYLGRAGVVERHGLRIAGLSGIHSPKRYGLPIPRGWTEKKETLKEPTYFRQPEVERLLAERAVDILLTHDWPSGTLGPFGNPQSRALLEALHPRLHLAGHMHRPARKTIGHPGGRETLLIGLNHIGLGAGDLVLFRWDGQTIQEL